MTEIIFEVREDEVDGGCVATALGHGIATQGETAGELRGMVRDAVRCHFGQGGARGTQVWCDPVKGVAYVLMVQCANFPNSDASEVRRAFQEAAAKALGN